MSKAFTWCIWVRVFLARQNIEHRLEDRGKGLWNGTLLDHVTVECIGRASIINDARNCGSARSIDRRVFTADTVHNLICIVALEIVSGQSFPRRINVPKLKISPLPDSFCPTNREVLRPWALDRSKISLVPKAPAPRKHNSFYTSM